MLGVFGAVGEDLGALYQTFKGTMAQVPDDMDTVATVIGEAATRFADSTQSSLRDVSQTALDFARVTGGDATTAIQSLGQAAHVFGLNADQAVEAMNVWTGVAQKTGISGNELATILAKNATLFDNVGIDASEAAVLIGQFHAAGIKSNVVPTTLDLIPAA